MFLFPGWTTCPLRRLILEGNQYLAYHYVLVGWALLLEGVVALGGAELLNLLLTESGATPLPSTSPWTKVSAKTARQSMSCYTSECGRRILTLFRQLDSNARRNTSSSRR